MPPYQKRDRLKLELKTATMRPAWAKAEAKRNPTTPALTRFIKDSQGECLRLKAELAVIEKAIQTEVLARELKI